jgi:hypothetical protein
MTGCHAYAEERSLKNCEHAFDPLKNCRTTLAEETILLYIKLDWFAKGIEVAITLAGRSWPLNYGSIRAAGAPGLTG